MNYYYRKIKRKIAFLLVFLLSINSYAAIVSDNDGSAFVTKAEFDALKESFNNQIDTYNKSIDGKIDGAIASYLAGLQLANTALLSSELNKVKLNSELGSDYKFGKAWTLLPSNISPGVHHSIFVMAYGNNSYKNHESVNGVLHVTDSNSRNWGGNTPQPYAGGSRKPCLTPARNYELSEILINGINYNKLYSKILYNTRYYWEVTGTTYRWADAIPATLSNLGSTTIIYPSDGELLYDGMDGDNKIYWDKCTKSLNVGGSDSMKYIWGTGTSTIPYSFKTEKTTTAHFRSYYDVESKTSVNNIGYCVDDLSGDMVCLYNNDWNFAWWDDTNAVGVNGYGTQFSTPLPSGIDGDAGVRVCINTPTIRLMSPEVKYNYPIYRHKTFTISSDTLINSAAQGAAFTVAPTYYYSGLPVTYCSDKGTIELEIRATASKKDGTAVSSGTTWSGKLYLNDERFQKNTTESHVYTDENNIYNGSWTFSNTDTTKTINLYVQKGTEIWLKYVPDSSSNDILVEFQTVDDTIIEKLDW